MTIRRRSVAALALTAALAALFVVATPAAHTAAATQSTSQVMPFTGGAPIPGAWSQLVRSDNGVAMTFHTNSLTPGTVVSAWWVFFNDPDSCDGGCGLDDVLANRGTPSVQRAAAHVIGEAGIGNYGAYFAAGATPDCTGSPLPCNGLADARTTEVHLVLRTHGPADPELITEQLSSFGGGCTTYVCANVQVSVHQAG